MRIGGAGRSRAADAVASGRTILALSSSLSCVICHAVSRRQLLASLPETRPPRAFASPPGSHSATERVSAVPPPLRAEHNVSENFTSGQIKFQIYSYDGNKGQIVQDPARGYCKVDRKVCHQWLTNVITSSSLFRVRVTTSKAQQLDCRRASSCNLRELAGRSRSGDPHAFRSSNGADLSPSRHRHNRISQTNVCTISPLLRRTDDPLDQRRSVGGRERKGMPSARWSPASTESTRS